MPERDERFERLVLESAQHGAAGRGFVRHVTQRLEAAGRDRGDEWAGRPLEELLAELAEEAADLGAWGVLAAQSLRRAELTDADRAAVRARVAKAIVAGAAAHAALEQAADRLLRAGA